MPLRVSLRAFRVVGAVLSLWIFALPACRRAEPAVPAPKPGPAPTGSLPAPVEPAPAPAPAPAAPVMTDPVAFWDQGHSERQVDAALAQQEGYLLLDLGEAWTPYLFTDGSGPDGASLPNAYRATYLALARGELPDDIHGERAKHDKYLELYGIPPTLSRLRERLAKTASSECIPQLDLTPLQTFSGLITYSNNADAEREYNRFQSAKAHVVALMRAQQVESPDAVDVSRVSRADVGHLKYYTEQLPRVSAMSALQARLRCEEILVGRGKYLTGVMDWATHESLAEFERRHRIFSQGYLGRESRLALAQAPLDLERASVLRVLTERALHAAGVIEDGSVEPAVYLGRDGFEHPVPNLAAQLEAAIVGAFGLETPETTLAFLQSLGDLPADAHRFVAIKMVPLPEYYASEMPFTLDYDRGDVWYDFPYDDHGKPVPQPVKRRPQVTVSTVFEGQKIALARYGTTIGGWRTELVDGTVMWKYKDSSVGPRAWEEIVAAPVWLPPEGTPPEDLLRRNYDRRLPSDPEYVVNYHEVGPSYASAYGLVAAYHRTYLERADGRVVLGSDEGIRTHGSVDYMSIMRRHSHGCHRLHNHIALRLMSFVLAHRPHQRVGQRTVGFRRELRYQDKSYLLDIPQTGYTFKLDTPLRVNVEEGNVLGVVKAPITFSVPLYDPERQAYVMADGTPVRVRADQLVPLSPPLSGQSAAAPRVTSLPLTAATGAPRPQPRAATSPQAAKPVAPSRWPAPRAIAAARAGVMQ